MIKEAAQLETEESMSETVCKSSGISKKTKRHDSGEHDSSCYRLEHTLSIWHLSALFFFAIALRAAVAFHPYSGENTPPTYGDFEAQRHWMEITLNLPARDWYRNTTDNDLTYWGLDYPPLSAYLSRMTGWFIAAADPAAVALYESRGYETEISRAAMRFSVIITDVLVFFPSLFLLLSIVYHDNNGIAYSSLQYGMDIGRSLAFCLTLPAVLMIDHAHFQYNNIYARWIWVATVMSIVAAYREVILIKDLMKMKLGRRTASNMHGRMIGRLAILSTGIGFGALAAAHCNEGPQVSKNAQALRVVPLNMIGIAAHYAASVPIPRPFRNATYSSYCSLVGCDASEADKNLEEFRSLADFFARRIRVDLRPIDQQGNMIVPCDGHVLAAGPVGAYGSIDVKGLKYRIHDLMGASEREPLAVTSVAVADRKESGSRLWYVVIHIGPENCHRFVSPARWIVKDRRNIEGYLLWMNPQIEGLYTQNERVAVVGKWDYGLLAVAAVGAAGRGSIVLEADGEPFEPRLRPKLGQVSVRAFDEDKRLERGEWLGQFRLGSAIVLLFEAPEANLRFEIQAGDFVKLGQQLVIVEGSPSPKVKLEAQDLKTKKGTSSPSRARFRRAW
ncbi:unnamed protein product [Agarophyton chilense]